LAQVLGHIPSSHDDRVLVDFRTADDAGVYRWDEHSALVQTVDFFTPVVDDPATYGAIAAANALSDVYAMGGRPLTALAIAGFPKSEIDEATIREIFLGGLHKLREAGVALLGGHTVQDREIKFGYAVTGIVHPDRIWTNARARPGDVLFLTKPIGTGVIATAIKFNRASQESIEAAIDVMVQLNRAAAEALMTLPAGAIHACTDITGFGLLGHASEMAQASGVTLSIDAGAVPLIAGALDLASNRSGGLKTNEGHFAAGVAGADCLDPALVSLLFDPQTSGGLLVSIDRTTSARAASALEAAGIRAVIIGEAGKASGPWIALRSDAA
jgi:selenide, water dikinase